MQQRIVYKRKILPIICLGGFAVFVFCFLIFNSVEAFSKQRSKMTLHHALIEAYKKNPDLEAARASLRAVDETYVQATAGFKPSVSGVADYTSTHKTVSGSSDPKSLSFEVNQSVFSGGSTMADVSEAENNIKSARASLKVTEQTVFLEAVKAYMNFISNKEIVALTINNEKVFDSHLRASEERFKLGDITRTDVSQAKSRLAKAKAGRIAAQGNLKKSQSAFEKVIGLSPLDLEKPHLDISLPKSQTDALSLASRQNPEIIEARYNEKALKDTTRSIQGENLPQIDLTGSVAKIFDPVNTTAETETTSSVNMKATLSLYEGGATLSRIRQSRQSQNEAYMETMSVIRKVRESVINAWEDFVTAGAETKALEAQIEASKMALDGVKVEFNFGSRTTLALLDAEQEYLDAQVSYVAAETNRIVAAYSLLASMGGLTIEGLKLKTPVYNSGKNFQNITENTFLPSTAIFRGDFKKIRD